MKMRSSCTLPDPRPTDTDEQPFIPTWKVTQTRDFAFDRYRASVGPSQNHDKSASNGTEVLTSEIFRSFADASLWWMALSINASEEGHDRFRGESRDFSSDT
jgi:hypothetical protein